MQEEIVDLSALPINCMGLFFYYCLPIRKKIILTNIDIVYKNTISLKDKKRLAISFYSHLATSIREFIHLRFTNINRFKSQCQVRGVEYLLQAASQDKGILLLAPHIGNWEYASAVLLPSISQFKGTFHFISKSIKNKFLAKILLKNREESALNTIPAKGGLKKTIHVLNKNDAVFFILDQHSSIDRREGIAVNFFGVKAGTFVSLAALARRTKTPVVPSYCYRDKNGHHIAEFFPALEWIDYPTREEAIYQNTLIYNQTLEKMILAHPEQWYWVHRRWKMT